MRKNSAMVKYFGVCLLSLLLLGTLICLPVSAAEPEGIRLKVLDAGEGQVVYTVESPRAYQNALAVAASYYSGQLREVRFENVDLEEGTQELKHMFDERYTDVKIFLLDGASYTPLTLCGEKQLVRVLDHDGTLLQAQYVYSGQTPVFPLPVERKGYLFAGWSGDCGEIYAESSIVANYVEEKAANIFVVSSAEVKEGEEITISVTLTGTVRLCAYDMNLFYDSQSLEFVSMDSEQTMDVTANHIVKDGRIRFNFSSTKDRTRGGEILEITFRLKDSRTSSSKVFLEPVKVYQTDPENSQILLNAAYTLCEGVIVKE